jgi:heat shock protein HtpX
MKRIGLFLITNLAIVAMIILLTKLFGVDRYVDANGLNYSTLLVYSLVVGFTGAGISLLLSKRMAKWQMNMTIIDTPSNSQERWLLDTIARLSQRAGLPNMPEVGIYEGDPNAFATGPSKSNALVGVSTGLLSAMERDEVEAVLAHEIAHIANGDMVTMTLVQGVMNTFVVFISRVLSFFIDSLLKKDDEDGSSFTLPLLTFVFDLLFGVLAALVVAAFSRHREYRADAGAAHLMGESRSMQKALRRLDTLSNPAPLQGNLATLGFNGQFGKWFSSHPPIAERIARLAPTK